MRRRATTLAIGVTIAALLVAGWTYRVRHAVEVLYSQGIAVEPDGGRQLIAEKSPARLAAGTRVLQPVTGRYGDDVRDRLDVAKEQQQWLAAGIIPGSATPSQDMVHDALLDLRALTLDNGATVAGWSAGHRYVWPRDSSFVAAAYARSGHPQDAERLLLFLQSVQHSDGRFEGRYRPSDGRPPDRRGIQLDGSGWVLWATLQAVQSLPGDDARRDLVSRLRVMVDRATAAATASIANPRALPPPYRDYTELRTRRITLGTAAPLLAGLRAAVTLYGVAGDEAAAGRARVQAERLGAAIEREFGPRRYPRFVDGARPDVAVAFLLPPFAPAAEEDVLAAWQRAGRMMRRPGGGLAPSATWSRDGVSWTPQTAMFALVAAASGRPAEAEQRMAWLSSHRTRLGTLPEKVLAGGQPAAVAPLAWTAALVVLTAAELDAARG